MNFLEDVTEFFQADRVLDVASVSNWVAAVTDDRGLALVDKATGASLRLSSRAPLVGPLLIEGETVYLLGKRGRASIEGESLELEPFAIEAFSESLEIRSPHQCLATDTHLYYGHGDGNLLRISMKDGSHEVPCSPYGSYRAGDQAVVGVGRARKGIVVLARHANRSENLVDALPDDPTRPKARAAILKDDEWGRRISGPAVAGRRAHLLCHDAGCLLSLHLRRPEILERTPLSDGLAAEQEVLLAADEGGRAFAASTRGLDLIVGPGAPARFPFPHDGQWRPSRLLVEEGLALVATAEGRVFRTVV